MVHSTHADSKLWTVSENLAILIIQWAIRGILSACGANIGIVMKSTLHTSTALIQSEHCVRVRLVWFGRFNVPIYRRSVELFTAILVGRKSELLLAFSWALSVFNHGVLYRLCAVADSLRHAHWSMSEFYYVLSLFCIVSMCCLP